MFEISDLLRGKGRDRAILSLGLFFVIGERRGAAAFPSFSEVPPNGRRGSVAVGFDGF